MSEKEPIQVGDKGFSDYIESEFDDDGNNAIVTEVIDQYTVRVKGLDGKCEGTFIADLTNAVDFCPDKWRVPAKDVREIETKEPTHEDHVRNISRLTQNECVRLMRHAPAGHPYFDKRLPYNEIFVKHFESLGGMTVDASKTVGWKP